jgi:D-lactate dehydrogenase
MRVTVYSTRPYDREFLTRANGAGRHELVFLEARLDAATVAAADGAQAVCVFVNDRADAEVLRALHAGGVRLVALRCAGFNHVDLVAAATLGVEVGRVPEYSPYAVAEHTAALVLTLNRKLHRAYSRVREGNLALEGLLGFDLHGRTVGLVGTGRIGACFARIMAGFGCRVLATAPIANPECEALGVRYVELADLLAQRRREPALPPDAADAAPDRRRRAGLDEARGDADQHQPRRRGRYTRRDRRTEIGPTRQPGPGRLRRGG